MLVVNECETKANTRKVSIPLVVCKFPNKRNPFHNRPENEDWMEWIFQMSCIPVQSFNRRINGACSCIHFFYPFCDRIYRFELLVKSLVFLFVIDDHTECKFGDISRDPDECKKIWNQLGEAFDRLQGNDISMRDWRPYIISFYISLEEILLLLNDVQKERVIKEWRNYIEGNIKETQTTNEGKVESLEQWWQLKSKSGAVRITLQAIEFADNIFVPEHVWNDKRFQKILDLAGLHMNYINDIFSYEKEVKDTNDLDQICNAVHHIKQKEDISIQQSMEIIATKSLAVEEEIRQLMDEMINEKDCLEVTKTFLDHVTYSLGGNFKMSLIMDRYNKV